MRDEPVCFSRNLGKNHSQILTKHSFSRKQDSMKQYAIELLPLVAMGPDADLPSSATRPGIWSVTQTHCEQRTAGLPSVRLSSPSAGGGGRGVRAKRAYSKGRSMIWTIARSCLFQTIHSWGRVRKAKGPAPPPPPHCTIGETDTFL